MQSNQFWKKKTTELRFLTQYAQKQQTVIDFKSFNQAILKLKKEILYQQIDKTAELSETSNFAQTRYANTGHPVSYSYQRYDLQRIDLDWLQALYFTQANKQYNDGLFLASGMSAVAALFTVFSQQNWSNVQFSPIPHFETRLLAQRFFNTIDCDQADKQFSSNKDILWLDSSSLLWPKFPEYSSSIRLIVVDSTCVEPNSPHIQHWLLKAQHLNCRCVVISNWIHSG